MIYNNVKGVPDFEVHEFEHQKTRYCVLIPIINEGDRIIKELNAAKKHGIGKLCDIIICDGDSTDGCTEHERLKSLDVNALLVKKGDGKQGAQLRMGFHFAIQRGYDGFITIDGNNKDSINDVVEFMRRLDSGYDFIQGSRFVRGGIAINTPPMRYLAVRLLHAPITSLAAGQVFTDTTNAFRGYSLRYLTHPQVNIFRDVFSGYELLAYLSTKAPRLGLRCCEIPVKRRYPPNEKAPTKIKGFKGNANLFTVLIKNALGKYD